MNTTILAVAVLAMAAFAGVMIVGDDTDATAGDGLGQYTVTYSFDGSSVVKKMGEDNSYSFLDGAAVGLTEPDGYKFDAWKDVKSGAKYTASASQSYTFTSDITVEPVFVAEESIVKLVYGDVVKAYFKIQAGAETPETVTAYTISLYDLGNFAKAIGAKVYKSDDTEATIPTSDDGTAVSAGMYLKINGFAFDGFYLANAESKTNIDALVGGTTAGESIYTAVFKPIYDISFVVEGATLPVVKSNEIDVAGGPVFDKIPGAPSKENYSFIGWYDAEGKQVIKYSADAPKPYSYTDEAFKFTADTTLYAKFVPINMTVTFQVGEFTSTQTVLYGEKAMKPELPAGYVAWMFEDKEFDFDTPITKNITIVALAEEPATIYDVTFKIQDKADVVQKSDSMVLPDTTRAGYDFKGWVVDGASQYVDPMTYEITGNITFVAVYEISKVAEYTVTFVNGDEIVDTVKVVSGAVVEEIDAPEGMFWLFDFETAITADTTIEAKPLIVTVQFAVGEKVYNAYTQVIAYGEKIDVTKLTDFIFPDGYDSWNYDFNEPVTADMTVYAKAIPEPEKEPAFYETPMGQCAIVLAVFVVGLILFGVFTGKIELPKFKVSRVKPEEPEQVEEEKKP